MSLRRRPCFLTPISLSATSTASASAFGFRLRALRIRSCSVGEGVVQIEAVPWLPYGGTNRSSCALQVRPGLEGSEARGDVCSASKDESSRLSPGHRRMPRSLPISSREREPFLSVSTFPCRRGSVGEGSARHDGLHSSSRAHLLPRQPHVPLAQQPIGHRAVLRRRVKDVSAGAPSRGARL